MGVSDESKFEKIKEVIRMGEPDDFKPEEFFDIELFGEPAEISISDEDII